MMGHIELRFGEGSGKGNHCEGCFAWRRCPAKKVWGECRLYEWSFLRHEESIACHEYTPRRVREVE